MDIVQQGWLRYLSVVFDFIVYVTTLQLTVTRLGVEKFIMADLGSGCKSGPVNVVLTPYILTIPVLKCRTSTAWSQ